MSRLFAGTVPLMWSGVMIAGAALTAAASVLLVYWISPAAVAVVGLPAIVVGVWMIVWTVRRYRVGALVLLLLSLPLGRLTVPALDPVVSPVTVLAAIAVGSGFGECCLTPRGSSSPTCKCHWL